MLAALKSTPKDLEKAGEAAAASNMLARGLGLGAGHVNNNDGEISSSSATTSDEDAATQAKSRERNMKRRARRRLKTYLEESLEGKEMGLTVLERRAITRRTETTYMKEYQGFTKYCDDNGLGDVEGKALDTMMSTYFQFLFFLGYQASRGEKIFAALLHMKPQYTQNGKGALPRAWRALKGWRILCPGRTRKPLPKCFWMAVACLMHSMGQGHMAVFLLLSLSTYMRPSEMMSLRRRSLLPPQRGPVRFWTLVAHEEQDGKRSKTGNFDVAVIVDQPWAQFLTPVLEVMETGKPDEPVWEFNYQDYSDVFKKVVKALGCPKVVPYQVRHSGASIDRAESFRSQEEVRKRGQWRTLSSVVRYEKAGLLNQALRDMEYDMVNFLHNCERLGDQVLCGAKPLPGLPESVVRAGIYKKGKRLL